MSSKIIPMIAQGGNCKWVSECVRVRGSENDRHMQINSNIRQYSKFQLCSQPASLLILLKYFPLALSFYHSLTLSLILPLYLFSSNFIALFSLRNFPTTLSLSLRIVYHYSENICQTSERVFFFVLFCLFFLCSTTKEMLIFSCFIFPPFFLLLLIVFFFSNEEKTVFHRYRFIDPGRL